MGEEKEIVVWPKHHDMFYKITASSIAFQMKTNGTAAIGLSKKPGTHCDYLIFLGYRNRVWARKREGNITHNFFVADPYNVGLVSVTEYRKFLLSWHSNCIQLYSDGDPECICKFPKETEDLYYITFSNAQEMHPVFYKFTLPPLLKQPKVFPIPDGKVEWVLAEDQLPDGVLIGGHENETLYIIRAEHQGSLTPGKFVPSEGIGYVPWGGDSNEKSNYLEVLCGYNCIWIQTHHDKIPVGAIEGGRSEDTDEKLYIGRAVHEGHLIPGKVQPTHEVCYIPYNGKEIAKSKFEILVDPNINLKCAHKLYTSNTGVLAQSSGFNSDPDSEVYSSGEEDHVF